MVSEIMSEAQAADIRREGVLDAAVGVFARYGYRKTSMDEVARAAGVSRQGLYLQFADKEALFRTAVEHKLARQLSAALLALSNPQHDLESRLIAACVEWAGHSIGALGGDAADLMCASTSLAGSTLADYHGRFEKALATSVAESPLLTFCNASSITPADVATALHATARGLKHSCQSRSEFVQGMTAAARLFCAPLRVPHQE
jgi:AcrR family transcriptional regulator